jgi:hypothetical protein
MYSLERLTATEPNWDFAFIFVKGMDDPLGIDNNLCTTRWLREESLLEISIPRVPDPTNPPQDADPGGMGPNGPVEARPATPGGLAKLTSYVHTDEIIAINFYNSFTKEDYDAIGAKAKSREEFLKKKNENQEEAKKEELLKKQKEQLGLETGENLSEKRKKNTFKRLKND